MFFWHATKITFFLTSIQKLTVYINTCIIPELDLMFIQKTKIKSRGGIISNHHLNHHLLELYSSTNGACSLTFQSAGQYKT